MRRFHYAEKLRLAAAAAAVLALAGCVAVDRFGERATQYNIEAETVRSQSLLLNIVRAALRKPLQFSELTTVTGSATASAGIGTSVPLAGPASAYSINPSTSVSGGPSFTVATLNTKGFFSGILAPIPVRTVGSYLQAGYSAKVLLLLLTQSISFTRPDGMVETVLTSDVLNPGGDADALTSELEAEGIAVRPVVKAWGLPVKREGLASLDAAAKLQAGNFTVIPMRDGLYQLVRPTDDYRFCFDTTRRRPRVLAALRPMLSAELVRAETCDQPGGGLVITTRSTLGVIYFLGEIARAELGLRRNGPAYTPEFTFPLERGLDAATDRLFVLRHGRGDPTLTVGYGADAYSIEPDPTARDHSSQVLDLVLQLLSLNSDAKDLPSPNTVTLISH